MLVGAPTELGLFRAAVKSGKWSDDELSSITRVDLNSSYTTCNAQFARILVAESCSGIEPQVKIVTNDWHICRSLVVFLKAGLGCTPIWSITTDADLHLQDDLMYFRNQGLYNYAVAVENPELWCQAEEQCFEANSAVLGSALHIGHMGLQLHRILEFGQEVAGGSERAKSP